MPLGQVLHASDEDELGLPLPDDDDPWWESLGNLPAAAPRTLSWATRWRRLTSLVMPFSPRERAFATSSHLRGRLVMFCALVALVGVTAVGSVAAFGLAAKVAHGADQFTLGPTIATPPGGVLIQPISAGAVATPTPAPYLIGAWVSDSAPTASSVEVFVRVSHDGGTPAAGVPVRINVGGAVYGPMDTDAYGLAAFSVGISGTFDGYTPVFVTASATVSGQTMTAQTSFAPH